MRIHVVDFCLGTGTGTKEKCRHPKGPACTHEDATPLKQVYTNENSQRRYSKMMGGVRLCLVCCLMALACARTSA